MQTVPVNDILERLAAGANLNASEASSAFGHLVAGRMSPAQAGAFLMGLRAKGETAEELAAGVAACLAEARLVPGGSGVRVDTCGTGGDRKSSFNCSTAVALVLSAMGVPVVKHGNRSVSSSCGSADIVESLGLPMPVDPDEAATELAERGFVFLFAPHYHPAFKNVMPVRRDLGVRTLFNLMGPLLNPARPTHQIMGVYDPSVMRTVAEAMLLSGVTRAAVVHGAGGYDELTPFGENHVVWVRKGEVVEEVIDPADVGLGGGKPENVAVSGKEESLTVMRELLDGRGPIIMQHMLILNLALALMVLDEELTFEAAAMQARAAVYSGDAARKFGVL